MKKLNIKDIVKLNYDKIIKEKNYISEPILYKEWIEKNKEDIFIIININMNIISLRRIDTNNEVLWKFLKEDLISINGEKNSHE